MAKVHLNKRRAAVNSAAVKKAAAAEADKKRKIKDKEESSESSSEEEEAMAPPAKDSTSEEEEENETERNDDSEENSNSGEDEESRGFKDENDSWLKPKQKNTKQELLSSDDEDDEDMKDEFEVDEDEDEELEIERKSKVLDREMEIEAEEAEEELQQTIATQTSVYHLPTPEELEKDQDRVVPTSELRRRVDDILEVLAEFKARREPGRTRSEYIERLTLDVAELHGYIPELVELFIDHFGPTEALEYIVESDKPRPLVIRANTLKTRRKDLAAALLKRGVNLDPLATWSKVGLKIYDSPIPIGATPEYLAGHYMLQAASSMCPVMALNPGPKERVLDMSAAPGGKTSYIAQLMKNTGIVIANDLRPDRQKATIGNLHRLGVTNAIVCYQDGRQLGSKMKQYFDKVLLDSPCSGLGVISRDPSVKVQRTIKDVLQTVVLQKQLILSAVDALKDGGTMVYSTCSVCIHENEEVVNYLLTRRDVKLVKTETLDFGKPGFTRYKQKRFHPSLELTRRFYPHVHNMDGFYVAKIVKVTSKISDVKDEVASKELADSMLEDEVGNSEEKPKEGKNKSEKRIVQPSKDYSKDKRKLQVHLQDAKDNKQVPKKARKNAKVARPAPQPQVTKPKKKTSSKKVNLPRRKKL